MNWLREPDAEPIPGYKLVSPLGSGGFGEVWKCVAPGGIHKAIKFVFGNLNSLDGDSAKAEQEYKALERVKSVRHPFVVSMDRIEVVAGELLIVMELADKSLHDLFEEYRSAGKPGIPRDELLAFLTDAAEGLDHMIEKHSLQHLDIKPKNLFVIADRVKVADFGLVRDLAKQSNAGMMGGISPVYAAPETFANKVSKHSDQYSLAIVFVELLTGHKPFNGKNIRQLAMQHMTEAPDLSALPEQDRAAVAKALAKNADERFPSNLAFVKALTGRVDNAASTSIPITRTTRPGQTSAAFFEADRSAVTPPPLGRTISQKLPASLLREIDDLAKMAFGSEEGVLRPAILIGVGSFGRRALQQVRCRLLDRVGQLSHVPCLRFIYLDPDPDAPDTALSAPPDIALHSEHIFLTPLQPVTNYRRRQLDQLMEWLPREKLHAIPRSLRVEGSRSLGRLSFCDHYLRFMTRLRNEIGTCTHPETLNQSADASGLAVRGKSPSVYLFVSASGGTSGSVMDLGYAVRRSLEKMGLPDATVSCFVLTGAPEDPNSPPDELANIFATLTELNHYADPDVNFTAQYGGPEGPVIEGRGLPFTATYLLPMAARTPEAFRDCVAHLAGYVSYDLTTPLGHGLERVRRIPPPLGRTPFRGFGTFGVWYPRGLLLRSAARQIATDIVRGWAQGVPRLSPAGEQILDGILNDNRLTPEPVKKFIVTESATRADGDPLERLAQWMREVVQQAEAGQKRGDPVTWGVAAWDQARDWLGMEPTGESDSAFRRGRLSKTLDTGLRRAVEAWDNELTERIRSLEDLPGPRLASAEIVVAKLLETSGGAIASMEDQLQKLGQKREHAKVSVQSSLESCQAGGGGFSFFGNRAAKSVRSLVERIQDFVDTRVLEDLTYAAIQFYRRIYSRFDEMKRDLATARDRLGQLSEFMEAPIILAGGSGHNQRASAEEMHQTTLQGSNTMRVVLPHGEDHLDRSAAELLEAIPAQKVRGLEELLSKMVVEPRGGLVQICTGSTDLAHQLANPLIDQATAYLSELLPTEDVTAVEHSAARGDDAEMKRRVLSYIRAAVPLTGGPAEEERLFLLHPDTEAGRAYAKVVKGVLPAALPVPVAGPGTDLLFCREQSGLRTADLYRMIDPCFDAYEEAAANPINNPHSRFDVTEWLPLVE